MSGLSCDFYSRPMETDTMPAPVAVLDAYRSTRRLDEAVEVAGRRLHEQPLAERRGRVVSLRDLGELDAFVGE